MGLEKAGALLFGNVENMGGVYAVVCIRFEVMQAMGCVRTSSPFPDPGRQDAGQGCGYAIFDYSHVFFWRVIYQFGLASLFCPNYSGLIL